MRGVRFGVSGDHDSDAEYLRHFFGLVDRGLKETLNGEPLFLAGVQEELSLYRKTAKYPHIFESECHGNAEHSSLDQVTKHAAAGAQREYHAIRGKDHAAASVGTTSCSDHAAKQRNRKL
jgi:Bacterial archaeo-eukaryotic release factor family 7